TVGTDGADNLYGYATNDTLNGGAGDDRLYGAAGNDTLSGGDGNDYLSGQDGDDVLDGGTGADYLWGGNGNDLMQGDAGDDILYGDAGNDTLNGGVGSDYLAAGAGNDTYVLGRGYGADTVTENDSTTGNTDIASFLSGIGADQIWFRHVGTNLEVSIIGTLDKLTINNWYSGNQYHVEQFKTADGKTLIDTKVETLVQAMAAFSPPAAGQTTLPPTYQDALGTTIAANWQ
ncbi:MAG: calcium-binding protein, partial [Rhodocyclales bacterium]|nr:calcium-binding protein [Rhodocyclales bacterium]